MMTMCLRNPEYSASNVRYAIATAVKRPPRKTAVVSAATVSTPAVQIAAATGSAPDAMGRFVLCGCCRSLSRSSTSLIRYTTPESAQKVTNAAIARATAAEFKS